MKYFLIIFFFLSILVFGQQKARIPIFNVTSDTLIKSNKLLSAEKNLTLSTQALLIDNNYFKKDTNYFTSDLLFETEYDKLKKQTNQAFAKSLVEGYLNLLLNSNKNK